MTTLAAILALTTSGCLSYSTTEHPEPVGYAKITAVEIMCAAGLASIPVGHLGYGERFTLWLAEPLAFDGFLYLLTGMAK